MGCRVGDITFWSVTLSMVAYRPTNHCVVKTTLSRLKYVIDSAYHSANTQNNSSNTQTSRSSHVWRHTPTARRRVHFATVLVRPSSGHRPGWRQARHARIFYIGLTRPWNVWTPPRHGPATRISTEKNPMGGILRRESRHMPIEA